MADNNVRRYYSIGDVADMTGIKQHVLRYWESEFSQLRPRKNRGGNRAYTERDIRVIRAIRHLLYDEKYTVDGARKHLRENRELIDEPPEIPDSDIPTLDDIREGLESILDEIDNL